MPQDLNVHTGWEVLGQCQDRRSVLQILEVHPMETQPGSEPPGSHEGRQTRSSPPRGQLGKPLRRGFALGRLGHRAGEGRCPI